MILLARAAFVVPVIPYLAILLGLYHLGSAWWAMGLYHAGALAWVVMARPGATWRALRRGWNPRLFLALAVPCAASGPLLVLLFPQAGLSVTNLADQLAGLGVSRGLWQAFFIYYCGVTPWLEEWFWRGRLGSRSSKPDRSDLLFAGYHLLVLARFLSWPWLVLSFLLLAGAAWAWRLVYHRCGGLAVPVATHLVADVSVMTGVFILMR